MAREKRAYFKKRVPENRFARRKTGRFYVLCLSQKYARLFSCTLGAITEIKSNGKIPAGKAESDERFFEFGKMFRGHRIASASKPNLITHGHGGGREDEKLRISEYCRQVSKGVTEFLGKEGPPLLLAAVDYESDIFRSVNRYPHLLSEKISGNPDFLTPKQVHARAIEIMRKKGGFLVS
ncbi:MAG: hypothetical protein HY592_00390 [Candidatus Omnitrophica bacterium]|nr:hypothetical protein [Candidatus Omnitrophota bacterium]